MNGKYYWLKMKRDFFRRHDIHIIHEMENGREIVLFYIELMIESVDHEGTLRFSENKPYTNGMLARLTGTPQNIVEQAMNTLIDFGLVEIADDKTIVLPKVIEMIDSAVDNDNANRQRRYREAHKGQVLRNVTDSVTKNNASITESVTKCNESIEYRVKSIDIKRNTKEKVFSPPTLEDVIEYCKSRNSSVDPVKFFDYYSAGNWKDSKGNQVKNWKQKIITWEKQTDKAAETKTQPIPRYGLDYNAILAQARENDRKAVEGK